MTLLFILPAPLKNAIVRLHDDSKFSEKLGAVARGKALTQFDERIVIAQTFAMYDELFTTKASLITADSSLLD